LLEQNELWEETFLKKIIVTIQTLQHLHALIWNLRPTRTVLFVQTNQHLCYCQVVVPQFPQKLRYFSQFLSSGFTSNKAWKCGQFFFSDSETLGQFKVLWATLMGSLDLFCYDILSLLARKRIKMS
jgi:hypothetical protein